MGEQGDPDAVKIRPCETDDFEAILAIINTAAEAYRGVIPAEHWREPYMSAEALAFEIADGVVFSACMARNRIVGVMGVQHRGNVDLIRHAYVLPGEQGRGVGAALMSRLRRDATRPVLVGAWRAATWAARFYEGRGFARVADEEAARLLRTYWKVSDRQMAASVVLASPPLTPASVADLILQARRLTSPGAVTPQPAAPPPVGEPETPSPPR